jgi:tRNA (cmo5U34)-methyltransferase
MRDDFNKTIGKKYELYKGLHGFSLDMQYIIGRCLKRHFESSESESINILEMGSGLGDTTLEILDADERIKIIAVDNSDVMIEQFKNRFREKKDLFERVTLVNDDILNFLKNDKSKYHGIVSAMTLHILKKDYTNESLKYSLEKLDEDGIFVNGDKYSQDEFFIRNYHALIELGMLGKGLIPRGELKLFIDWVKHYITDFKEDIIMKEKESIEYMKEIGFKNINQVYRNHLEAIISANK